MPSGAEIALEDSNTAKDILQALGELGAPSTTIPVAVGTMSGQTRALQNSDSNVTLGGGNHLDAGATLTEVESDEEDQDEEVMLGARLPRKRYVGE